MANILLIEREHGVTFQSISFEEWKSAVASVEGVRFQMADAFVTYPDRPEETIAVAYREGSVEVYLPQFDLWAPAIIWFDGRAQFKLPPVVDDTDAMMYGADPIWLAAARLSFMLGAQIRGIDGELYDLESGTEILGP
jgi:hypothetical protein